MLGARKTYPCALVYRSQRIKVHKSCALKILRGALAVIAKKLLLTVNASMTYDATIWDRLSAEQQISLSALPDAARAYVFSRALHSPGAKGRTLIILPHEFQAQRFKQDLQLFGITAQVLPAMDFSPYSAIPNDPATVIERKKILYQAAFPGRSVGPSVFLASLEALSFPEPAVNLALKRQIALSLAHPEKNPEMSLETLERQLILMGYSRSPLVDGPGTFASRGYILDVFSAFHEFPARIEFFDTEIQSLKFFDPQTQRTLNEVDILKDNHEFKIIPCFSVSLDAASLDHARSKVKLFCDERGIPKKQRDNLFDRLREGSNDIAMEPLTPFFCGTTVPALNYFDNLQVIFSDELGTEARLSEMKRELEKEFDAALGKSRIAPEPSWFLLSPSSFSAWQARAFLRINPLASTSNLLTPQISLSFEETLSLTLDGKKTLLKNSTAESVIISAASPSQAEHLRHFLVENELPNPAQIILSEYEAGFVCKDDGKVVLPAWELLGTKSPSASAKPTKASKKKAFFSSFEELVIGDFIVHETHGIGRYLGLAKIEAKKEEFLLLEYAGGDKLYLPIYRLDTVQKYSHEDAEPTLDTLGSGRFEKAKERVGKSLRAVAFDLLKLYADRKARHGFSFHPAAEDVEAFASKFPYVETADQLSAIQDIARDMADTKIMDRLVCGDVGYGKTEVAMRAAYIAVSEGKQVAVLVPTTILAFQHERTFADRFKEFPVSVDSLSRFKTRGEIKDALERLKVGKLDIVIGTHRLLSKDVEFNDLGLLIIDEEHRFGVEHKEKLKNLKRNTDALTLTATPIPRTLQMSLLGLRDLSIINTPPTSRQNIKTFVARFDLALIAQAISLEMERGGQVFFVYNRVQSIEEMATQLRKAVPSARVLVAHAQMGEKALEERMLAFFDKQYDVLVSSTIIESGLDVPTANTMIIHRADRFGLAQLYQLRGRIGRSNLKAFCYLLLPDHAQTIGLSTEAEQRLELMQRYSDLGSGFKIASHDLELRGGGDVLGGSQSGHVHAVGYEMYLQLLENAILEAKGETPEDLFDPEIKVLFPTLIPESYIPDLHQRLILYRRLSEVRESTAIDALQDEIQDRFGKLPEEVENLLWLIRLKLILRHFHICQLTQGPERVSLDLSQAKNLNTDLILDALRQGFLSIPARIPISTSAGKKIIFSFGSNSMVVLYQTLHGALTRIANKNT